VLLLFGFIIIFIIKELIVMVVFFVVDFRFGFVLFSVLEVVKVELVIPAGHGI